MQRDVRVGEEKVGLGSGQAKEASSADEQQDQGGRQRREQTSGCALC